eukprot:s5357_g3.t1
MHATSHVEVSPPSLRFIRVPSSFLSAKALSLSLSLWASQAIGATIAPERQSERFPAKYSNMRSFDFPFAGMNTKLSFRMGTLLRCLQRFRVALFLCIFLVRRIVPGASKHWLCRTPHVCVCTLIVVSSLQCLLLGWRYNQMTSAGERDCPAVVTPWAFGAKGDGHTDDSNAIRMALDRASQCQSEVLLGRANLLSPMKPGAQGVNLGFLGVTA